MVVASDSKLVIAREVVKHTFGDNDNPRDGIMIGAGGAATTRNIIHEADMLDLFDEKPGLNRGMFLFDVTGASGEKAKVLNPRYRVADAKDMVLKICQAHPEIVREGLNPQKNLQTLYQASSNRIDARGYDAPINPADQIVIDGHPVNEERKKGV